VSLTQPLAPDPVMADEVRPADDQPSSETARIASDLMEMAREICFHTKTTGNKRLKLAQYLDNLLRPLITRDHAALQERLAQERKPRGRKPPAG
jgi:hypothetical protein